MGRDLHYVPGDFYRVDDRSGFPTRARRTKKEWNGYIVDRKLWEIRQPQDLVRGVPDYQAVPEPRPLSPAQYVGPTDVSIQAPVFPGQDTLVVASTAGFQVGTPVGVMLDDGTLQRTTVRTVIDGQTLRLEATLTAAAGSNPSFPNLLYNFAETLELELPRNFAAGT